MGVLKKSTVYPYGTTEQFPAMVNSAGKPLTETAHYYMECSNKGICDRKSGECECFDGYEGSYCQRASCPNDCSGHGTCETIAELAEDEFDNIYALWDKDMTMGCACDPGYSGPDCSSRMCKYGIDPLYIDDESTARVASSTYIVRPGFDGLQGTYAIKFYDVFGEDYKTAPIKAAQDTSCLEVVSALEALPNTVIPGGSVFCSDYWGQFDELLGSYEYADTNEGGFHMYSLTFTGNPGYLKPIEIDTTLDGVRPTTNTTTAVWSDGMTGEFTDYFATQCEHVYATITPINERAYDGTEAIGTDTFADDARQPQRVRLPRRPHHHRDEAPQEVPRRLGRLFGQQHRGVRLGLRRDHVLHREVGLVDHVGHAARDQARQAPAERRLRWRQVRAHLVLAERRQVLRCDQGVGHDLGVRYLHDGRRRRARLPRQQHGLGVQRDRDRRRRVLHAVHVDAVHVVRRVVRGGPRRRRAVPAEGRPHLHHRRQLGHDGAAHHQGGLDQVLRRHGRQWLRRGLRRHVGPLHHHQDLEGGGDLEDGDVRGQVPHHGRQEHQLGRLGRRRPRWRLCQEHGLRADPEVHAGVDGLVHLRVAVLEPRPLQRRRRHLRVLQGLHQRQLRHAVVARGLDSRWA